MKNMASCSSSAIIPHQETKHDVFINFRGRDTRKTLTSHLCKALRRRNVVTYKDDEKLEKGDEISPSLLTAIDRSKISVIIFSKSYASSWWCLDELVRILYCRKRNGQFVIPIYYNVDPFHVRHQRESYATDFAKLGERFKVERLNDWRSALNEASNLSGSHYPDNYRTESDLVDEVVEDIWRKLKSISSSYIIKGLFGIERRICQIEPLLCLDSPNINCVIGIWGMGGIGKTTIAEVLFDRYSHKFEACCFLGNVKEELGKHRGMDMLRRTLFSALLSEENIGTSFSRFDTFVRDRLRYKKALIVLDDVNHLDQLVHLVGDIEDFGPGTRIIITSRDKQVLRHAKDKICQVEELNCFEARKLFEFHAFNKNSAPNDYQDLCSRVINYAKGIPLALEILGSTLHGRSIEEWESVLDKLKKYPNDRIQGALKLSYDTLDFEEENIFLDIACFFKGWDKDRVTRILKGCEFYPVIGIRKLIDKSLISIGQNNKIQMHDLIQEMGRGVVLEESIKEPGNRSRVWIPEDVCRMLQRNTGTEQVEGIFYEIDRRWVPDKFHHVCQKRYLNKESFSKMKNVRLVKISYPIRDQYCKCKLDLPYGVESLCFPSAPSLFHWDEYPLKSLPLDLNLSNLVELLIRHSQLERLWDGNQSSLWNLREIDGSGSEHLIEIPDLSVAPNVKELRFNGCINLAQLPHLQNLKSLVHLNLSGCSNLKRVPDLPGNIEYLNLSGTGIQELPSSIEEAEKLCSLHLVYCQGVKNLPRLPNNIIVLELRDSSIEVLPSSIEGLSCLYELTLSHCKRLEHLLTGIHKLKYLDNLSMDGCSKLEQFPEILEPMENIWTLDLAETSIKTLPKSIMNITGLRELVLDKCENLEFLPYSICDLNCLLSLKLSGCTKLEKLPPLPAGLSFLNMKNCRNLKCLEMLPVSLLRLEAYNCQSLESLSSLKTQLPHESWKQYLLDPKLNPSYLLWKEEQKFPHDDDDYEAYAFDNCNCLSSDGNVCNEIIELSQLIILRRATFKDKECPFGDEVKISCPGNEIPKWFNHQSEGCSIHMDLPLHWLNSEFLGFALCFATNGNHNCKGSHAFDCQAIMCKSRFKTNNNESYETDYRVGRQWGSCRRLNSNHLFMFYYYPLHLMTEEDEDGYCVSIEGCCPNPNSTQASFTFYISMSDPCEFWRVKKVGIRMLYAADAEELGFVDVAKVEIATKRKISILDNSLCL